MRTGLAGPVFDQSSRLVERLHALVPGGAHTYAKGDDQYPEHMAPVIVRGPVRTFGMPTETSSSSTAAACAPSSLGTPTPA